MPDLAHAVQGDHVAGDGDHLPVEGRDVRGERGALLVDESLEVLPGEAPVTGGRFEFESRGRSASLVAAGRVAPHEEAEAERDGLVPGDRPERLLGDPGLAAVGCGADFGRRRQAPQDLAGEGPGRGVPGLHGSQALVLVEPLEAIGEE